MNAQAQGNHNNSQNLLLMWWDTYISVAQSHTHTHTEPIFILFIHYSVCDAECAVIRFRNHWTTITIYHRQPSTATIHDTHAPIYQHTQPILQPQHTLKETYYYMSWVSERCLVNDKIILTNTTQQFMRVRMCVWVYMPSTTAKIEFMWRERNMKTDKDNTHSQMQDIHTDTHTHTRDQTVSVMIDGVRNDGCGIATVVEQWKVRYFHRSHGFLYTYLSFHVRSVSAAHTQTTLKLEKREKPTTTTAAAAALSVTVRSIWREEKRRGSLCMPALMQKEKEEHRKQNEEKNKRNENIKMKENERMKNDSNNNKQHRRLGAKWVLFWLLVGISEHTLEHTLEHMREPCASFVWFVCRTFVFGIAYDTW